MVFGNKSCLFPENPALSEDPRRDSTCCKHVVCFVRGSHYAVHPWLQFVFWFVVWLVIERGVAVGVVAAFLLLVEGDDM